MKAKKNFLKVVGLVSLVLWSPSGPVDAAPLCGNDIAPVPHWVDTCPSGIDVFPSQATVTAGILPAPVTLDSPLGRDTVVFRGAPIDTPDPLDPGHLNKINTELCSLVLQGGGLTLVAGDGVCDGLCTGPLCSLGMIIEKTGPIDPLDPLFNPDCPFPADPTLACSFFDVFFEIQGPFGSLRNFAPSRVFAQISHVPPTPTGVPTTVSEYCHPDPVDLFAPGPDGIFGTADDVLVTQLMSSCHIPDSLSPDVTAQLTLRQERPGVPDDQLEEVAEFTLPAGDIDPITEDVTIALSEPTCGDPFSNLFLPAGSFAASSGGKIASFKGAVTDAVTGAQVAATVRIVREGGQKFRVSLDSKNADYTCLEGTDNRRVRTTLVVGNDTMSGSQCFRRLSDGDLFFPPGPGVVCP